jgi:hypothetical protein
MHLVMWPGVEPAVSQHLGRVLLWRPARRAPVARPERTAAARAYHTRAVCSEPRRTNRDEIRPPKGGRVMALSGFIEPAR